MASRKNFPDRIESRKASAKLREEANNKLTTAQKLAKAIVGSREYNRLQDRLHNQSQK